MNDRNPSLSVCIITKNEEEKLPTCIRSVQWAREVVIVDDFSSDTTPDICRAYPNLRYYAHRFEGFGLQKDYAISLARNEWVLNIDADEEVTSPLREEIIRVLKEDNPFSAFRIRRKNLWFGRYYTDSYPGALRLFRKNKGKFHGYVHEKVEIEGPIGQLEGLLLHKPKSFETFNNHYETYAVKYGQLAALDYLKRGERVTLINALWKIVLLPLLAFMRNYFIKRYYRLGKAGLYIAFCSSLCYQKAYLNLVHIQRKLDESR